MNPVATGYPRDWGLPKDSKIKFMARCNTDILDDKIRYIEHNLRTAYPPDMIARFTQRYRQEDDVVFIYWEV